MSFIFFMLSLLFSFNLTLIVNKMTTTYNAGIVDSPIKAKRSLTIFAFYLTPEIKWINMWRKQVSFGMETLPSLIKAIITEETYIKFWIHAILLDARVIIRPIEHTGAIWVLQSCEDKPREQGHIDLPSSKSFQTLAFEGLFFPFDFLLTFLKKGILLLIGMIPDV